MTLWDARGVSVDQAVLAFTAGQDPVLDLELWPYDCLASAAHARMLAAVGLLSTAELQALLAALREAVELAARGELEIKPEQEDGHTALEQLLTARAGEAGKKIHTGRSRNDQVIMALRLLVRERLLDLAWQTGELFEALLAQAARHARALMPGYSHTRQAMPSTVGQLFFAAAEGLCRDVETMLPALHAASRGALGAASGYGVPLPLDRAMVARALGLDAVDVNTLHVQHTRGKLEAACLFAAHQLSLTLSRFAADLIWFSSEAFGFFSLPPELTTGSSIMPQKRNPDLLELCRGVPAAMLARYVEVSGLLHGLPAGYHRDLQRSKEPLLRGLSELDAVLAILTRTVPAIEVDADRCRDALAPGIYATDAALARVRQGESFREAYRQVKEAGAAAVPTTELLAHRTHLGAPGTDQSPELRRAWDGVAQRLDPFAKGATRARQVLEGDG